MVCGMANEPVTTVTGNLTADPELRATASGQMLATFTVAQTPRVRDRESGTYTDGDTLFMRVTAWRELGEHAAESLHKGDRVVVTGRLRQHSWTNDEGQKRTVIDLEADEVAASVRFATLAVTKLQRGGAHAGDGFLPPVPAAARR